MESQNVFLVIAFIFVSAIQIISGNKTTSCDITGCEEGKICQYGKCVPTCSDVDDCTTTPCKTGFYCDENGKCIKEPSCEPGDCPSGQECYLEIVNCFVAPCPPIPSCRPDKCAEVKCETNEICKDGDCIENYDLCAVTLCEVGYSCVRGQCYKNSGCEDKLCDAPEKCYMEPADCAEPPCPLVATCKFDKCSIVRCASGTTCVEGNCIPD